MWHMVSTGRPRASRVARSPRRWRARNPVSGCRPSPRKGVASNPPPHADRFPWSHRYGRCNRPASWSAAICRRGRKARSWDCSALPCLATRGHRRVPNLVAVHHVVHDGRRRTVVLGLQPNTHVRFARTNSLRSALFMIHSSPMRSLGLEISGTVRMSSPLARIRSLLQRRSKQSSRTITSEAAEVRVALR